MRSQALLSLKLLAATLLLTGAIAATGDPATGDPVFVEDGAAIRGYDPVAYFDRQGPVKGQPDLTAEHDGATWWFSSVANRDAFVADPERYAPAYGGYCAYAASRGYKASTDPRAWTIVGDRLFLNFSLSVRETWLKDRDNNIRKADRNWPTLRNEPR
jgi:YHS domain-containing protein